MRNKFASHFYTPIKYDNFIKRIRPFLIKVLWIEDPTLKMNNNKMIIAMIIMILGTGCCSCRISGLELILSSGWPRLCLVVLKSGIVKSIIASLPLVELCFVEKRSDVRHISISISVKISLKDEILAFLNNLFHHFWPFFPF